MSITPSLTLTTTRDQTVGPSASDKLDLQERLVFSEYYGNTLFRITWEPKGRGCSGGHRPPQRVLPRDPDQLARGAYFSLSEHISS